MARPRKPTNLHLVQHTFEPARHRKRLAEPDVRSPLGDAPAEWPAQAKVIWRELANAIPGECAGKSDRIIVELTCRLLIEMRSKNKFNAAIAAQLRCCLASLGMTPADRSRVTSNLALSVGLDTVDEFFG